MKKINTTLLCLLLTANMAVNAQTFSGGSGTTTDPYIISTPEQLDQVHNHLAAHFKLANDIDLTAYLATVGDGYKQWGEQGWLPIGTNAAAFRGSFDGAGFKVTGLWLNRIDIFDVGLFGYIRNASIKNLGVVIGDRGIRGFDNVAGLVGVQDFSTITNCYAIGNVSGRSDVGGLIGEQIRGSVTKNCYTAGNISGNLFNAGGLTAHLSSNSTIENCYSSVNVSGNGKVGGLVGQQIGKISNSYATGSITGIDYVGGLVGEKGRDSLENCFFDTQTSGQVRGAGSGSQQGVTGKNTAEMKRRNTFTGWDFTAVWTILSNNYPKLR